MPKLKNFGYILDYGIEIGITNTETSLSFTEIKSWCELMNVELTPFEVSLLKTLSNVYSSAIYNYSENQEIPAPYLSDKDQIKINNIGVNSFKRMAKI